ncbi:hypothetical protein [Kitasatospora sp. NPDC056181]|uniref:hypothetical protein n=1 Tax=Kitasatospora sp. NPDC056181 TaxID=3345737 RepID=UPI0035DED625
MNVLADLADQAYFETGELVSGTPSAGTAPRFYAFVVGTRGPVAVTVVVNQDEPGEDVRQVQDRAEQALRTALTKLRQQGI